jgi:hypothetical protein
MEKHLERFKNGFVPFLIVVIAVFLCLIFSAINNFYKTSLTVSLPALLTIPATIYLVGLWLEKKSSKSVIEN